MLKISTSLNRAPGHRIWQNLRIKEKQLEKRRSRPGQKFLAEEILPKNEFNLRLMPDFTNPYSGKHLAWQPEHMSKNLYKDAEHCQKVNDLPPLLGGKFPRFLEYVDEEHCQPILSVKKGRLGTLSKIYIEIHPWQNDESEAAYEFWRRITPMEVRATNAKCTIDFQIKNEKNGEDKIILEFLDGEKIVMETKYMTIDEIWYHFVVAGLGRIEIAEKTAAGKMF